MSWLQSQHDDITGDRYAMGSTMLQQSMLNQSQFFNFQGFFLPHSVKELFRYSAHAMLTNSAVNPALEKLAEYPITEFVFTPEINFDQDDKDYERILKSKESLVKTWQKIFEHLQAKEFAMKCGLNFQTYGNVFVSVYQPFDRHLVCRHCGSEERAKTAKWEWERGSLQFVLTCSYCNKKGKAKVNDVLVSDYKRIHLISLYPGNIDIDFDPYSGETEYYYTIPESELSKIKQGNRLRLLHTPMDVIIATRQTRGAQRAKAAKIKFKKGNLFHLPRASFDLPGVETPWGIPNTVAVLQDLFYFNMMRRAQLALMMEHILPFRFVFPASDTGGNTTLPVDLLDWRRRLNTEIKKWKKDPLYIMVSPVPLAHDQMGGQGKALMLFPELEQVQTNLMNGLNVPQEFVRGGLQYSGTSVSLRMLENSLFNQVNGIVRLFRWAAQRISQITGIETVKIDMKKFKMADDIQAKQLSFNYWQAGAISGKTLGQLNDFDYAEETRYRLAENLEKAVSEAKAQAEAATRQQMLQSMLLEASPPEGNLGFPTIPHEQLEGIFNALRAMKPADAQRVIEQLGQQNPDLARQLAQRQATDPQLLAQQAQQIAAMPPEQQSQLFGQLEQSNPLLASIMDNMLTQMGLPPRAAQQPLNGRQEVSPNMPEQRPPRRSGGAAM
jgi:hypothetical protein